jgi:carbonic anhydrase
MDRLVEGFRRFRAGYFRDHGDLFADLSERGQAPHALVVSCCDSRVDPQLLVSTRPGDIFVVRNVANLVPPYDPSAGYPGTSAALEFGVRVLKVKHVVVLGHAHCGGVQALLSTTDRPAGEFVGPWMGIARPALERTLASAAPERRQHVCEHEVVRESVANLRTFPWIVDLERGGSLQLHGWYFDIGPGRLMALTPTGTFEPIG